MLNTKNWMNEWDKESKLQLANLAVRAYMKCSRTIEFSDDASDQDGTIDLLMEEIKVSEVKDTLRQDLIENGLSMRDCSIIVSGDVVQISKHRSYLDVSFERLKEYTDEDIFFHARGDEKAFYAIQEYLIHGQIESEAAASTAEDASDLDVY